MVHIASPAAFDFECLALGSIAQLIALTSEADEWLADNVSDEAVIDQSPYRAIIGEPRFLLDIALGMIGDGLTCEDSDKVELW